MESVETKTDDTLAVPGLLIDATLAAVERLRWLEERVERWRGLAEEARAIAHAAGRTAQEAADRCEGLLRAIDVCASPETKARIQAEASIFAEAISFERTY